MPSTKTNPVIVYAALFALMAVPFIYYDYFSLMCAPPVGTHIWRQTDSVSFAWCYWKNGLDFFHPQILNRSFGNGYAVSEFPVLQYIIALLYTVFGFHWWISKALYILVYFSGLAAIFKIANHYTKNLFWSYFISLLFFTAPALVFYGNSCVPDTAALSFSFIGFSFFLSHQGHGKKYFYGLSMLFFCLAGLMKVTYLLLMFCSFAAVFLLLLKRKKVKEALSIKYVVPVVVVIAINLIWYFWSDNYNKLNEYNYFLSKINPVWYGSQDKAYILKRTLTEWALRFFAAPTNYLFLVSLLLLPAGWIKGNKFLSLSTLFLLLGSIAYYLLWYLQFLVHDYYTILFYALYLFSFLNMLVLANKFLQNYIVKAIAIILLLFNMFHVKEDLQVRYKDADLYAVNKYLTDKQFEPYIRSIGIKEEDMVIAFPDGSPQTILCALHNPGFTEFKEKYSADNLNSYKERGAKYLIIIDKNSYQDLIKQLPPPTGEYNDVLIYKL